MGKWSNIGVREYHANMEYLKSCGMKLEMTPDVEYHFVVPGDLVKEQTDYDKALTIRIHKDLGVVPKVSHEITPGVQAELDRLEAIDQAKAFKDDLDEDLAWEEAPAAE